MSKHFLDSNKQEGWVVKREGLYNKLINRSTRWGMVLMTTSEKNLKSLRVSSFYYAPESKTLMFIDFEISYYK